MCKKHLIILFVFGLLFQCYAQKSKTIKVYFLYGSKPATKDEPRYFGGMHGGHVTIGIDTAVVGFVPANGFHIFAHKKNIKSTFSWIGIHTFRNDTAGSKYTTFEITVADSQYTIIKNAIDNYLFVKTPYDYAFIGMRCASAAYDILSQAGIFKRKSNFRNIISNFYPKKLRKKMFRLAAVNKYSVTKQKGCTTRKWEND